MLQRKEIEDIITSYYDNRADPDVIGVLKIPKIDLKQPIYKMSSVKNQVDLNVTILKDSVLPPTKNHEIIFASHSGTGEHAYFKRLEELTKKDEIYFDFQDYIYKYEIISQSKVKKDGTITLPNYNFDHLVLITCSKTENNIQFVYIAKLCDMIAKNT